MTGRPLQIISITGKEDTTVTGDSFKLESDNLTEILSKVPPGMKVSVVSIVGAFRTGKSFMLNFFLRYLRSSNEDEDGLYSENWMVSEGAELTEGNMNMNTWSSSPMKSSVNEERDETKVHSSQRQESFAWKGGNERQTTGIWMWSEPFIRKSSHCTGRAGSNDDDDDDDGVAVLLMDTQGMFDNETTMSLTAQIFGLSTLVSSFQIYNVEKRIGEDNLQHLALFSEYGRMALSEGSDAETGVEENDNKSKHNTDANGLEIEGAADNKSKSHHTTAAAAPHCKPFQRLQFLIRDYQNYDLEDFDWEDGESDFYSTTHEFKEKYFAEVKKHTRAYLGTVINERASSDLQVTRNQIQRCFQSVDCFLLPHPGAPVTKKTYNGKINLIDPFFRALLNRYVRTVFSAESMEPKFVGGRFITGPELKVYFEVYADMFTKGTDNGCPFPVAMTMLEATALANNRNALELSLTMYKQRMDASVNPRNNSSVFLKEQILQEIHVSALEESSTSFDKIAIMGPESMIQKYRDELLVKVELERERFFQTNALRNPFKDMEMYAVPLVIAAVSWLLAFFVDKTCSTDICEKAEDTFVKVYLFVFFAIIVLTWKRIQGLYLYMKELLPILMQGMAKHKAT